MARVERVYRRLPGRGVGLSSYHRLWLGPDHVLSVRATGYSEEYKRFYFRDVQAIILRGSVAWKNWNLALLTVAGLLGFVSAMTSGGVGLAVWLGLACLFVALLLINLARGPTCVCHILTAVQMERLPALGRIRVARRVMERLRPMIEQAQGDAAPAGSAAPSPGPSPASTS